MNDPAKTNSIGLTEGPSHAPNCAMLRGGGFTRDDLRKLDHRHREYLDRNWAVQFSSALHRGRGGTRRARSRRDERPEPFALVRSREDYRAHVVDLAPESMGRLASPGDEA